MSTKPRTPDQKTVIVGTKPAAALWAEFVRDAKTPSEAELREQGFLPSYEVAEMIGMSRQHAVAFCRKQGLEEKSGRIASGQTTIFFRPKV